MLETLKTTRLAALTDGGPVERINTFFWLDRDQVRQLAKHEEWSTAPMRADEAEAYEQFIAHMRANTSDAAQQDSRDSQDSQDSRDTSTSAAEVADHPTASQTDEKA